MRRIHKFIVLCVAMVALVAGSVAATAAVTARHDPALHAVVNPQSVHGSSGYATQNENLVYTGSSNSNDPIIYSGTSHISDTNWLSTGVVQLTYDRNVGYCSVEVTPYALNPGGRFWYGSATTGLQAHPTRVTVYLWTINDNGDEVPANGYAYVVVSC